MKDMKDKHSGAGCALGMGLFLILPLIYVLGVGPASWIGEHYPETQGFLEIINVPLAFVVHSCEPVAAAMEWYISFWV